MNKQSRQILSALLTSIKELNEPDNFQKNSREAGLEDRSGINRRPSQVLWAKGFVVAVKDGPLKDYSAQAQD